MNYYKLPSFTSSCLDDLFNYFYIPLIKWVFSLVYVEDKRVFVQYRVVYQKQITVSSMINSLLQRRVGHTRVYLRWRSTHGNRIKRYMQFRTLYRLLQVGQALALILFKQEKIPQSDTGVIPLGGTDHNHLFTARNATLIWR